MKRYSKRVLEARGGIEPPIKVLQTFALPLGDRATESGGNQFASFVLAIISSGQIYNSAEDRRVRAKASPYISRVNTHVNNWLFKTDVNTWGLRVAQALLPVLGRADQCAPAASEPDAVWFVTGAPIRLPHSVHEPS
jgi:hypothetical protein